jgi:AcrR family transcriptional regulator
MNDRKPPRKKRILTPQERRQRNREEMSNTILATALEIMREDGAGALNLNELARRMHLRPSSLYVYFSGKMAIYDALYALGIRMYRERLERITQTHSDPWEALQAALESGMELSVNNPELFQICFERPIPGFEPSAESMAETDKITTEMYMLLNRVMPVDEPEPHRNVPQAHGLFIAMWQGLIALHLANDPGVPVGSGRFGSLIPAAIALFKTAWDQAAS